MTNDESQRLRVLAYHFWEEEGRPDGRAEEHWQKAQRQLQIEFCVGFRDNADAGSAAPAADEGPRNFITGSILVDSAVR